MTNRTKPWLDPSWLGFNPFDPANYDYASELVAIK